MGQFKAIVLVFMLLVLNYLKVLGSNITLSSKRVYKRFKFEQFLILIQRNYAQLWAFIWFYSWTVDLLFVVKIDAQTHSTETWCHENIHIVRTCLCVCVFKNESFTWSSGVSENFSMFAMLSLFKEALNLKWGRLDLLFKKVLLDSKKHTLSFVLFPSDSE